MTFIAFLRAGAAVAVSLSAVLVLAGPAAAQSRANVDCGNGYYCPAGNACLLGGMCAAMLDSVPGGVKTSTGEWCAPGRHENKYAPGECILDSHIECAAGVSCPVGARCSTPPGQCTGGPPVTGPQCGSARCYQGEVCSSAGLCMNPQLSQDCGNGTFCPKVATCRSPKGCVYVEPGRTPQIRKNP